MSGPARGDLASARSRLARLEGWMQADGRLPGVRHGAEEDVLEAARADVVALERAADRQDAGARWVLGCAAFVSLCFAALLLAGVVGVWRWALS